MFGRGVRQDYDADGRVKRLVLFTLGFWAGVILIGLALALLLNL